MIQKTIATISDLLDVKAEVETKEEWTLEDLIKQHWFNEQEAAGYHVDELDPEPEPEPLIIWLEVLSAFSSALQLFELKTGDISEQAQAILPVFVQYIWKKIDTAKKQTSLFDLHEITYVTNDSYRLITLQWTDEVFIHIVPNYRLKRQLLR